jgi:hypothetical protein
MKLPNSQPMMIAWTRRSGLMPVNPARIVDIAPLLVSVSSSSSAPKTMNSSVPAMIRPWMLDAAMADGAISHPKAATARTTTKPTGMACLAGQRRPTSRIPTTTMGDRASRLRTARLSMGRRPFWAGRGADGSGQCLAQLVGAAVHRRALHHRERRARPSGMR